MLRDDGFPSYRAQLREVLRAKIEEGEYPPGTAIPSENELAAAYGLNRRTVREAVALLVREGLLRSVAGKGVYVRLKAETRLGEGEFGFRLREPHRLRRYCRRLFSPMPAVLCVLALLNAFVFSRGFEAKARLDSPREVAELIRERAVGTERVVAYRSLMQNYEIGRASCRERV